MASPLPVLVPRGDVAVFKIPIIEQLVEVDPAKWRGGTNSWGSVNGAATEEITSTLVTESAASTEEAAAAAAKRTG
eukprot:CAMPEP_0171430072 /NCGR_PEP_ID=MMETSP0881-20121228/6330_1 /TAXON_ID=67004 /ORGANISM="Thalassiosira weissflogii, Strain CCMP1336" /LENGTH=75 /DNA_ID=CAMNT_0011950127 /DNA_START=201 /DNA_END=426 /DNA_ORIENTATION=-